MEPAWYELAWPYGWLTAVVAVIGLFGLFWYARSTAIMARATKRQGEVLTYPTVSVFCKTGATPRQPYSDIRTQVVNTSQVHAYTKVTLKAVLHLAGTDQIVEFPAPAPYDGSVWPLSANQGFNGHFAFDGLKARALSRGDSLTLEGTVESKAFGSKDGYRENPPIYYRWKDSSKEWVPEVPPQLE